MVLASTVTDMSLAARTRRAAADHPFLVDGLRAGVVNYTAAARYLAVDGETEAVATALRRYAEELPEYDPITREARVTMQSGVGTIDGDRTEEAILVVGGTALGPTADGDRTAILATGDLGPAALRSALASLALEDVTLHAAGADAETMTIVVDRLDGATAIRTVERSLESVSVLDG